MREILFRGKRENNDEWVEGFFVENHFSVSEYRECLIRDLEGTMYKVIPETVGQYTGLKDRNNVKAFEGDIVACSQSGSYGISVIVYDNSAFYVMPLNGNILERTLWDYWYNDWDIEVIGNVFDNPELLEVKVHE